jgi:hypothetical protein
MNERLETLKSRLTLNWGELQKALDISESTLYFLRTGARNPSPKLQRRILELEQKAGLSPAGAPGSPVQETAVKQQGDAPEKEQIIDARSEVREIAAVLRDLAARIDRLEKTLNK